jgi:pantoate--beta-alanine ligase
MPLFRTYSELSNVRTSQEHHSVGLVPTMGALHQGHLELIRRAHAQNEHVWVSIFVNPTQFNNPDDLAKYPNMLTDDIKAIEEIDANIHIFAPAVTEMYPDELIAKKYEFRGFDKLMEGADRPGHFDGVITIVAKLFELIKPNYAYFGEKDFQQLQIIKNWVDEEAIPTRIVPCPIVREANGLAMSSRNERLSKEARAAAGFIYRALLHSKNECQTTTEVERCIDDAFAKHSAFKLLYLHCLEDEDFKKVEHLADAKKPRLFVATAIEGVRLIDNIALK